MSKASEFHNMLSDVLEKRDSYDKEVNNLIGKRPVCECDGLGLFEITNDGNLRVARIGAGYEFAKPGPALRFGEWLVEMFGE